MFNIVIINNFPGVVAPGLFILLKDEIETNYVFG